MGIVSTTTGPILGREKGGVFLFAGVPYAAPPVGPLRFRPPAPHPGWTEPLETRRFGPAAPQTSSGGLTDPAPVRWSEDCLTLNIQTPALDDARRPVLFWIHGGAYRTGQGAIPWYNGTAFCRQGDLVVVSINYRLGALGFTDLSMLGNDYSASGVNGTLDQIAALEWVRANIDRFGGDPQKITIAGESAGAFSVATLLANPRCKGLFRGAILQSGAGHHTLDASAARKVGALFLQMLGAETPAALETISVPEILVAQGKVIEALDARGGVTNRLGGTVSPFYPWHGNAYIPAPPIEAIRQGAGRNVAVLVGSNQDETTLWGYGEVDDAKLARAADSYNAHRPLAVRRASQPTATAEDLLIRLTTDHMFRIPAIRLAEARANTGVPAWMYLFAWPSQAPSRTPGRVLGATHALEIPFAFNTLTQPGVRPFLGPPLSGSAALPQAVADTMHAAWTRFIRFGNPGWDPYQLDRRATFVFAEDSRQVLDPDAASRQAWEGIR